MQLFRTVVQIDGTVKQVEQVAYLLNDEVKVIDVDLQIPDGATLLSDEEFVEYKNRPLKEPVPLKVTMRQARLALLGTGLLDQVESLLQSMEGPEGQAARIEWDYSSEVHRNKPFVQSLGSQLGLTEEQLDQLFITASQID